jgi:hypothetical protein
MSKMVLMGRPYRKPYDTDPPNAIMLKLDPPVEVRLRYDAVDLNNTRSDWHAGMGRNGWLSLKKATNFTLRGGMQ